MNVRTGRREEGGVGSKNNEVLDAYCRDILNDNGDRLLTFAANHDLAMVNTFFITRKGGISRTFIGHGQQKPTEHVLSRHCDRNLARDVKVFRQPNFLPISDHNIVVVSVRLLGRSARNSRVRMVENPRTDLQCRNTDPDIGREVVAAVAKQLREKPPNGDSVDEAEAELTDTIMRTAGLVIPRKRH